MGPRTSSRAQGQFKFFWLWIAPLPGTALLTLLPALLLERWAHERWTHWLLIAIAVAAYFVSQMGIKKFLTRFRSSERFDDGSQIHEFARESLRYSDGIGNIVEFTFYNYPDGGAEILTGSIVRWGNSGLPVSVSDRAAIVQKAVAYFERRGISTTLV